MNEEVWIINRRTGKLHFHNIEDTEVTKSGVRLNAKCNDCLLSIDMDSDIQMSELL